MTISDKTLAKAFLAAEKAEESKLRARAIRVAATVGRVERETPASERLARGLHVAARPSRDGAHATGRMDAKFKPIHATHFEGDRKVTGALCKLRASGSNAVARKQSTIRASVASANRAADACKRRAILRAERVKGGSIFNRCKSRAMRRALRAAVHNSDTMAAAGDWSGACKALLTS